MCGSTAALARLTRALPRRSGHRMVVYKGKIVLFGGFYDAAKETKCAPRLP